MAISTGSAASASDFVSTSAGAGDSGKVPKLNASGVLDKSFMGSAFETTTGTTHSLTTTANQKILVLAKGDIQVISTGARTVDVLLKYNGITKDTIRVYDQNTTSRHTFSLMYTETPGAATQNVTVETAAGTTAFSNVVIIVMKI